MQDLTVTGSASDFVPHELSYPAMSAAARHCRGCELYQYATQTVFGAGPVKASLMLIGEQPGNEEDLAGQPFIGPAGKLLQRALDEAGVTRSDVYVTNTVKHFRFEQSGKFRRHVSPAASHIKACKPWLKAELAVVKPDVVLCLGAVAAKALLGPKFSITKDRGRFFAAPEHENVIATFHPSAALRAPDADARQRTYNAIVEDLAKAKSLVL